jgi:ligand-binding SRPBCC domain-containing protein
MRSPGGAAQRKGQQTEIVLKTSINAPIERCFDLSRSIDFHLQSASHTGEQAIGGVTSGLIGEGQEVVWRAKHFGLWLRMRVRITGFEPPFYFQDSMIEGPFRLFTHDHNFETKGFTTAMADRITFRSPAGWLMGRFIMSHLRRFILNRNSQLKTTAESDLWRQYLRTES